MNILYGVSGEGFGHSSRALSIASYLEGKGHKVMIVTYGQAYKVLKNKFKIFKVKGLHLIFEKSVLKKRKTFAYNLEHFPKNLKRWQKFHKLMNEFKPDVCISDMEPIVPILRYWYDLPLISIDNQHRLTNLEIDVPKKYNNDFLIAKNVVDSFVKRADAFIVTSFGKAKVKKKKTFVVPPIIRPDVVKLKSGKGKKILVYLTKKDEHILNVLKKIDEIFLVYGYNKKSIKGNLEFKTRDSFLTDLKNCRAVVATAGFTLMSEALYLKKPYFALPLKGQFEQVLNALFLRAGGFGDYSEGLSERDVKHFLKNLKKYENKLKNYNPDSEKLYKVLDSVLKRIDKQFKKKDDLVK